MGWWQEQVEAPKGFIMEDVIFLIFGGWLDLTENERFLRKLFKIRNDQHYNTKLFCSQKVFPKPTICLIKHKIESENQIFGSRLLNRNMTTSIIKPLPRKKMAFIMNENEFWLFQNQGQNAIERKKGKMCNHMHFAQRPMLFCVFLYFFSVEVGKCLTTIELKTT